jgi:hypothetical protein
MRLSLFMIQKSRVWIHFDDTIALTLVTFFNRVCSCDLVTDKILMLFTKCTYHIE